MKNKELFIVDEKGDKYLKNYALNNAIPYYDSYDDFLLEFNLKNIK